MHHSPEFKEEGERKIHRAQSGVQSCLRGTREVVFWPSMNQETDYVKQCDVCNTFANQQLREPLMMFLSDSGRRLAVTCSRASRKTTCVLLTTIQDIFKLIG